MGFEWMLTLSIKEKKLCSYKTVPLNIIDQPFKKKNDRDLDPPVRERHQSKGLIETFRSICYFWKSGNFQASCVAFTVGGPERAK
jgi:hypothetical protein